MKNEKKLWGEEQKSLYISPTSERIELGMETTILEYSGAGGDGEVLPSVNL